jgi:hypothetical protein
MPLARAPVQGSETTENLSNLRQNQQQGVRCPTAVDVKHAGASASQSLLTFLP